MVFLVMVCVLLVSLCCVFVLGCGDFYEFFLVLVVKVSLLCFLCWLLVFLLLVLVLLLVMIVVFGFGLFKLYFSDVGWVL